MTTMDGAKTKGVRFFMIDAKKNVEDEELKMVEKLRTTLSIAKKTISVKFLMAKIQFILQIISLYANSRQDDSGSSGSTCRETNQSQSRSAIHQRLISEGMSESQSLPCL
jgi:hypothetical protein